MRRFRRLFIVISSLGYAFLGGGPSLWALGLEQPPSIGAACAGMGCTCKVDAHQEGKKCCCRLGAKLLKKFPELAQEAQLIAAMLVDSQPVLPSGELRQQACSPFDAGDNKHSLPDLRPHLSVDASVILSLALARSIPLAAPRGVSFRPEPPTPVPD